MDSTLARAMFDALVLMRSVVDTSGTKGQHEALSIALTRADDAIAAYKKG